MRKYTIELFRAGDGIATRGVEAKPAVLGKLATLVPEVRTSLINSPFGTLLQSGLTKMASIVRQIQVAYMIPLVFFAAQPTFAGETMILAPQRFDSRPVVPTPLERGTRANSSSLDSLSQEKPAVIARLLCHNEYSYTHFYPGRVVKGQFFQNDLVEIDFKKRTLKVHDSVRAARISDQIIEEETQSKIMFERTINRVTGEFHEWSAISATHERAQYIRKVVGTCETAPERRF
jgi:hypothetical protein